MEKYTLFWFRRDLRIVDNNGFYRALNGEFDVVVALYHDQGHIPTKLISFEESVNVTLGTPLVRTSVDHGTAHEIAWEGKASSKNLLAAINYAKKMIRFQ